MKKITIVFVFFLFGVTGFSRTAYQDSLYDQLIGKIPDSTRSEILLQIAESYLEEDNYQAIKEARQAIEFARKAGKPKKECRGWFVIGSAYNNTIRFSDAHEALFKSLKIAEEIGFTKFILQNYNQIGIIYSYQKNSKQAHKYFTKFLEVALKTGNKSHIARGYNNLGISLKNEGKNEEAIASYKNALRIFKEMDFTRGMISCYSNIGVGMMQLNQFDSAAYYYKLSGDLALKTRDTFSMAITYINKGELLQRQHKISAAIHDYNLAIQLSQKPEMIQQLRDAHEGLYKCYELTGDYKLAFLNHQKYLSIRDSILNDETNGKLNLAEQNYMRLKEEQEREKKEQKQLLVQAQREKELAKEKARNEETQKYIWIMVLVSLSVIIMIVILFLRYKEKNKSNKILQHQRDEIAESKKEITDSINYALRIQQAVLPEENELKKYFIDHFILYRPKDIVSGDFYWFTEANGYFYLAVADCTGHGVPGGFMSMIGIDKLNHAVFEEKLTDPGKILSSLSRNVKKALKQNDSESSTRDGMDISLLCCKIQDSRENFRATADLESSILNFESIFWSGANRPLWKVANDNLEEIKPTKSAIGGFTADDISFETHEITAERGTSLYLFSDGFADQFGLVDGRIEKKMTTRKLRDKLLAVQPLVMSQQKEEFNRFFDEWKGPVAQMDDVCIVGICV